jgi:hypothetical protein
MKKITGLALFIFILSCTDAKSQGGPVYPIPSYNIEVNGYANFTQSTLNQAQLRVQPMEKVEMNVIIKSSSGSTDCQATVWVYSLDNNTVLGPFTVSCDQLLQVSIDTSESWGVLVDTDEDLLVSVWVN